MYHLSTTHSIKDDDQDDNEDECQHNGHYDDPHRDLCTCWGAERGDDGNSNLSGLWGGGGGGGRRNVME